VLAHENVLTQMRRAQPGATSPFPSDTWPTETFEERRRTMYFNDEGIEILKLPSAHTDADTVVFFRKSDVIVAGLDLDAARVLSHESVLTRMRQASPGGKSPFPTDAWPSETFEERRRAMYFNDEGIEILKQAGAHTDADTIVFFRKSDVVVAGNIIDADRFPVIDLARGGSLKGEITALNRIIELAIPPGPFVGLPSGPNATARLQGGTDVLPGHGRIFRQIDVVNYRDMLVIVSEIVQDMINRKMTLDQIKAADPAKPFKARYGATSGPWTTNDFVEAVYKSLTNATS